MKKLRRTDFQDFLTTLQAVRDTEGKILVITHERPDGDAVGAACGLWTLLTENGYAASLFFQEELPDAYTNFVPAGAVPETRFTDVKEVNSAYSCVFAVDVSTPDRLGFGGVATEGLNIPLLALDHHSGHVDFADLIYVNPENSSASEIVFYLAEAAKWQISPEAATYMLLGITTDTGCFRFDNTTPSALRAYAALLEKHADHHKVIERAFFSKPINMAAFEAELFCHFLRTAEDGKIAWFVIEQETLQKYDINIRNTENLIEKLREIESVEVVALLKPTSNPGIFKISLRSKRLDVSVGNVARRLNGNGHELAAGCTIYAKTVEAAEEILIRNIKMELK